MTNDRSVSQEVLIVEAILNSRPLTSASDDPNYFNVLKLNYFIIGRQVLLFSTDDDRLDIRKRWTAVEALSNIPWIRFTFEYILSLNICRKWNRER